MKVHLVLAMLFGLMSMGATTHAAAGGFQYETDLEVISAEELHAQKPGVLSQDTPGYYLHGWIRLKEWPEKALTIIPRCRVKIWNENFKIDLTLYNLSEEKSELLIPLGKSAPSTKFKVKIK